MLIGMGGNMLISEAFELYVQDRIIFANQSAKTEEQHRSTEKHLINYFGDVEIESLKVSDFRNWKISLNKKVSDRTVRNYVVKLRVVLRYLYDSGYKVVSPSLIPVPKAVDRVPTYIPKEDVALMIEAVSVKIRGYNPLNRNRNGAIISLLYASGIRVSELCAMDRDDIVDNSFSVVGKGGKARLCFVDERSMALIKKYLMLRDDSDPALFISNLNGRRITPDGVQEVFKTACRRAGFTKNIHPHTMRHSFSTDFLRNNGNLRYLQVMLGHSSLQTTQMYCHVVDKDLQEQYKRFHTV